MRADELALSLFRVYVLRACAAITALQLQVFCTTYTCLASLSSLTEAEPEIPFAAYMYNNEE